MEGGLPLTLTSPAGAAGFNVTVPANNRVVISGLPCEVRRGVGLAIAQCL